MKKSPHPKAEALFPPEKTKRRACVACIATRARVADNDWRAVYDGDFVETDILVCVYDFSID